MSRLQRILGSIIAGIGSLVCLFAFFSLPSMLSIDFPTLGPPSSATALRLVTNTAAQHGDLLSWLGGGLAAILLLGIVVQALRSLRAEKVGARLPILLATLALLVLLIEYLDFLPVRVAYLELTRQTEPHASSVSTGSSPAYYLGPGFWFYLVGMVLVLVGGVVSRRAGKDADLRQEGAS